jgi:Ca2+-transporting ATPase
MSDGSPRGRAADRDETEARAWHHLGPGETAGRLRTDPVAGLTSAEAGRRLHEHGRNELVEGRSRTAWAIVGEQVAATMVLLLLAAAAISAALGDLTDATAILVIVVLNVALGFHQEFRAERAIAALRSLAVPHVKVRRDGGVREVAATDLVPGDVMVLEAGNVVAADARLLESVNLRTQEAPLTGESEPVEKTADVLPRSGPGATLTPGDRRNMVFMGTAIAYGRGAAIVTSTGMRTELGAIATMLQAIGREPTPLQHRLDQLGRRLAVAALAIVAVILVLGLLRGEPVRLMFLTAVSMAVAAVPEGLPAVVTIALALGSQRMLGRQALVRKLAAVETLGSVSVICSDKTGTLTQNRMRVAVIEMPGRRVEATRDPVPGMGAWISEAGADRATAGDDLGLALLLAGAALCNDAGADETGDSPLLAGDPTESALVAIAAEAGLDKARLELQLPRTSEVPFDSGRKRMTTVHRLTEGSSPLAAALRSPGALGTTGISPTHVAFTKGAADRLLAAARHVWTADGVTAIDDAAAARIVDAHDRLAQSGMRVLGIGVRLHDGSPGPAGAAIERDLTFVGLVGLVDPPRPEARAAVATCAAAGVRAVMITGDHPLTAAYVAGELGIGTGDRILTGAELERLTGDELAADVERVDVFARVSPEHKLAIVEALQGRGHIVAMTGDGVNDAPALKRANIGVAMGRVGSDVSRESADMVLLDDNFATIVAAVEEGRIIYDNIRKFVRYLLTTNSGELWLMLVAPFLGMPLPLLPLQILWINLVTDGPPALTLGVEPAERGVMRRPPHPPSESIFARGLGRHVLWVGLLMGSLTLGVGYAYWRAGDPGWQTMVFTTLAFAQMAHVLAIRAEEDSTLAIGLFSNRWLAAAVLATIGLQLAVVYVPGLNALFDTVPLSLPDLGLCGLLACVVFAAVEIEKWPGRLARRR